MVATARPSTLKTCAYVHTHATPPSFTITVTQPLHHPLSLPPISNLPALILITQNADEEPAQEIEKGKMESDENGEGKEREGGSER